MMQRQPSIASPLCQTLFLPQMASAPASDAMLQSGSVVPYGDRLQQLEAMQLELGISSSQAGTACASPNHNTASECNETRETAWRGQRKRDSVTRSSTEGMLQGDEEAIDQQVLWLTIFRLHDSSSHDCDMITAAIGHSHAPECAIWYENILALWQTECRSEPCRLGWNMSMFEHSHPLMMSATANSYQVMSSAPSQLKMCPMCPT
jgi:hypothetical protein